MSIYWLLLWTLWPRTQKSLLLTGAVCVKMQLLTDSFIKSVFYLYINSAISFKFVLMLDSTSWCWFLLVIMLNGSVEAALCANQTWNPLHFWRANSVYSCLLALPVSWVDSRVIFLRLSISIFASQVMRKRGKPSDKPSDCPFQRLLLIN